jgi:DNA-binding NarL/FixJ family response regulator
MKWWARILQRLGLLRSPAPILREQTVASLQELSARTRLAPDDLAEGLFQRALLEQDASEACIQSWQLLTRREQHITALICLGCNTREITELLNISPETVKTHARKILAKFGVNNRIELRRLLSGWDFNAWRNFSE